jgi:hypothetical protein
MKKPNMVCKPYLVFCGGLHLGHKERGGIHILRIALQGVDLRICILEFNCSLFSIEDVAVAGAETNYTPTLQKSAGFRVKAPRVKPQ